MFEKSRNNSLKNYGLLSSHLLSAPGLSWDAMPKMTKIQLPDTYISFEKGIRGGISYILNRHSKANNKYLKCCEPKQESKHTTDLDVNNLHGFTMSKFLPTRGFKWTDLKDFNLNKYTSNSSKGCNIEVDLEYPKELKELHNYYPLTPEKIEIKRQMLSEYQLKIADL